jgi:hypothetical protein
MGIGLLTTVFSRRFISIRGFAAHCGLSLSYPRFVRSKVFLFRDSINSFWLAAREGIWQLEGVQLGIRFPIGIASDQKNQRL